MDRTFVGRDDQVELHGAETPPDCFALRVLAQLRGDALASRVLADDIAAIADVVARSGSIRLEVVSAEQSAVFVCGVVPAAEAAGVRLALHPNDPPVPEYRGVAQPLWNLDAMKRLIEVVDSPANCVFFDTGVTTEYGDDAVEAIRYFGSRDRIGIVHFRNVRVEEPYYKYTETFVDEGECDIAACMRAFAEVGYAGGVDPDHTPGISDDTKETQMGWAYAVGQLRALRLAAYA